MSRRLAGKFSTTARHREDARRCDRLARAPTLHPHCVVVQENHRYQRQLQAVRDCQPVMTVHHEEDVLLRRDRNSPAIRAEDLRLHLRDPVGIDLFGRDQACWRKEANLHIDQPDFCQQKLFGKRLQGGTASLVPMHDDKENRGLQARQLFTNELLDQRAQQRRWRANQCADISSHDRAFTSIHEASHQIVRAAITCPQSSTGDRCAVLPGRTFRMRLRWTSSSCRSHSGCSRGKSSSCH
jgi:hypothetical protein